MPFFSNAVKYHDIYKTTIHFFNIYILHNKHGVFNVDDNNYGCIHASVSRFTDVIHKRATEIVAVTLKPLSDWSPVQCRWRPYGSWISLRSHPFFVRLMKAVGTAGNMFS